MYHAQGPTPLKRLGFERRVPVQGGLPIPITTPAHGTAFDIVGQGKASVEAMRHAFAIACRMGKHHARNRSLEPTRQRRVDESLYKTNEL